MRPQRAAVRRRCVFAITLVAGLLVGCDASAPPATDSAPAGTTAAIAPTEADFLEFTGGDIFGDVAAGAGSVWIATLKGLIQVDPDTMTATWHTDLVPGQKIVYAFDSLWVADETSVHRVDPATLKVLATLPAAMAEGVAAARDGIWVGQHRAETAIRIDPETNTVAETVTVVATQGSPMAPSIIDEEMWVALGNTHEVVRVDANRKVTNINVPSEVVTPAVATPEEVWFTNGRDVTITRINRVSGAVTSAELPSPALERFRGVGAGINIDGTLWFPTPGDALIALDPVTADIIGTVPLRGSIPRNAIVYDDALWLMSEEGGSLERIPMEKLRTT